MSSHRKSNIFSIRGMPNRHTVNTLENLYRYKMILVKEAEMDLDEHIDTFNKFIKVDKSDQYQVDKLLSDLDNKINNLANEEQIANIIRLKIDSYNRLIGNYNTNNLETHVLLSNKKYEKEEAKR